MPEIIEDIELSEIIALGDPIEPIPNIDSFDASVQPIAPILYSSQYASSMAYLRAVMSVCEYSVRSLKLTEYIIALNPAHYTIWTFRYDCLLHLSKVEATAASEKDEDTVRETYLIKELSFIENMARESSKNYQLWHHRELIHKTLGHIPSIEHEKEFLDEMIEEDAKNYHVWCFRQWLARTFFDFREGEVGVTERLIKQDPFNNSAWNHRYFILFELATGATHTGNEVEEIEWCKGQISRNDENESAWNYLSALLRRSGFIGGAETAGKTSKEERDKLDAWIRYYDSLPALKVRLSLHESRVSLSDDETAEQEYQSALAILRSLQARDTIRVKYWTWRTSQLDASKAGRAI